MNIEIISSSNFKKTQYHYKLPVSGRMNTSNEYSIEMNPLNPERREQADCFGMCNPTGPIIRYKTLAARERERDEASSSNAATASSN